MTGKGGGGRTNKARQKRSTGVGPSYQRRVRRKVTGSDALSIFPRSDSPPIHGGHAERRKRPTPMELQNVPNTSDMETQPPMTRESEEPRPRLEQDPEIFLPNPRTPVHSNRDNLPIRDGGVLGNSTAPIRDFQAIHRNGRQLPQMSERENETPGGHSNRNAVLDRRRVLGTSEIAQLKSDPSFRIFLENLQRTLLTKFNTVESAIKNLRQEVYSVKNLVTDGMLGMKAGSSSGLRKKSKRSSNFTSKWAFKDLVEQENASLGAQVEFVFGSSLLSETLTGCVCHFMEYTWSLGIKLAHTHLAMAAFLYGHNKTATKKAFACGLALVHCDFKFRYVKKLFESARRRRIDVSYSGRNDDRDSVSHEHRHPQREMPHWLETGYVGKDILKITRKLVETKEKPPKPIVETVKGREAIYIAQSVYAMVTDFFRESRVAAKKRFFEDLGFMLIPWESRRGIPEGFQPPKLSFKYPDHYFNIGDQITSAVTSDIPNAVALNKCLLREMSDSRLELHVLLEYDVLVGEGLLKNGGQRRGFQPAQRKRMHRTINLAVVSLNFFLAYTQGKDVTDFLCSHSGSLRTVFRTALLFRLFVNDVINGRSHLALPSTLRTMEDDEGVQEQNISGGGTLLFPGEAEEDEADQPQHSNHDEYEESEENGSNMARVRILNFLPGLSKQKDVLDAQILRISPAAFDKLCTIFPTGTSERENAREAGKSVENMQQVQDQLWEDDSNDDDEFNFEHLLQGSSRNRNEG